VALKPVRQILINGVGYSFASVKLTLFCEATGKELDLSDGGYSAVNFSRERERGEGRGPHPDPQFKTRGSNKYSASIKFYMSMYNFFIQDTLGGPGYGDRFFVGNLQYLENGLDPVTIDIQGCTLDKDGVDNSKGTDATEVDTDLHPLKILRNGIDDVDNPLAAA
jgi:hypothetical protein